MQPAKKFCLLQGRRHRGLLPTACRLPVGCGDRDRGALRCSQRGAVPHKCRAQPCAQAGGHAGEQPLTVHLLTVSARRAGSRHLPTCATHSVETPSAARLHPSGCRGGIRRFHTHAPPWPALTHVRRQLGCPTPQAVLLLDADFLPSSSLLDRAADPRHRAALMALLQQPLALVLPAFETAGKKQADAELAARVGPRGGLKAHGSGTGAPQGPASCSCSLPSFRAPCRRW